VINSILALLGAASLASLEYMQSNLKSIDNESVMIVMNDPRGTVIKKGFMKINKLLILVLLGNDLTVFYFDSVIFDSNICCFARDLRVRDHFGVIADSWHKTGTNLMF